MEKLRFKNNSGSFYTKALFYETTLADKETVAYTLKDQDHQGYPSLYRLYLEEEDLTEYDFANKYLGGWSHWKELTNCTWFKDYVDRWREELQLKVAAKALKAIKAKSRSDAKDALSAQQYLLERKWEPKEKTTTSRGRPSKEEIRRVATEMAEHEKMLEDAQKRIFSSETQRSGLN